ncbi:DUF4238 domain-containing protein [Rhizobium leguminosarum bv. trifolii]|nr:DUF4238 domain-containing protein [Rhizobium leguminosarum bv. trifolii]
MSQNPPRDHHYIPQFYLRNFSADEERKKLFTVMRHGHRAVWAQRAIKSIGFERDLYVHMNEGAPVSVETEINSRVETPISKSDTWSKIASGRTEQLDITDKPILYALIRHLETRTPHYLRTVLELANLSGNRDSGMKFSDKEHKMYAEIRRDPEAAKEAFNLMSASLEWTQRNYRMAAVSILRSPIPLRTSTKPVHSIAAPAHPALYLPHPGQTPFQLLLALNKMTMASLVFGDFDNAFMNDICGVDVALGFNRNVVGQFAYFEAVTHLVADRDG